MDEKPNNTNSNKNDATMLGSSGSSWSDGDGNDGTAIFSSLASSLASASATATALQKQANEDVPRNEVTSITAAAVDAFDAAAVDTDSKSATTGNHASTRADGNDSKETVAATAIATSAVTVTASTKTVFNNDTAADDDALKDTAFANPDRSVPTIKPVDVAAATATATAAAKPVLSLEQHKLQDEKEKKSEPMITLFCEENVIDGIEPLPCDNSNNDEGRSGKGRSGKAAAEEGGASYSLSSITEPGAFHEVGSMRFRPTPPPARPSTQRTTRTTISEEIEFTSNDRLDMDFSSSVMTNHHAAAGVSATAPAGTSALPIAAQLVDDCGEDFATREELEERIRQEYNQKLETEYVRKSFLNAENSKHNNIDNEQQTQSAAKPLRKSESDEENVPFCDRSYDDEKLYYGCKKSTILLTLIFCVVAIIGTILGVTLSSDNNSNGNTDKNFTQTSSDDRPLYAAPRLSTVRKRGYLVCRAAATQIQAGRGLTIDLCHALAVAVFYQHNSSNSNNKSNFNFSNRVQYPSSDIKFAEHFQAVENGIIDVSASYVSHNMQRNVREVRTGVGFAFSTPYLYTGTGFAGIPEFVDCAEAGETFANICRFLKVCVLVNSVTQSIVEKHLSQSNLVPVEASSNWEALTTGSCNVVADDKVAIHHRNARDAGYQGEYKVGDKLFSYEQLALMTRQDDVEWAEFCDWVIRALITAEAMNITDVKAQNEDSEFWETDLFGPERTGMFREIIASVGHYGQIYDRQYGEILPRVGYNLLNTGGTGMITSDPFGNLQLVDKELITAEDLPRPIASGTIEAVVERGFLLCGVRMVDDQDNLRLGFAEYNQTSQTWSGLDVDICRALAASLSAGSNIDTVIINLSSSPTITLSPGARFIALADQTIDVLAGEPISMITDVREPVTGHGFTFTSPYFYYNTSSALALLTREDDHQWSLLTKWVTQCLFYAEEHGINQTTAARMPIVELFGTPKYLHMFRDAISMVGNYGQIYDRFVEAHFPRSGRNMLNNNGTSEHFPILDPFE